MVDQKQSKCINCFSKCEFCPPQPTKKNQTKIQTYRAPNIGNKLHWGDSDNRDNVYKVNYVHNIVWVISKCGLQQRWTYWRFDRINSNDSGFFFS